MNAKSVPIVVGAIVIVSAGLAAQTEAVAPAEGGRQDAVGSTIVVEITDDGFRPATVTVRRGDVVRFLQHSAMPHNVEFLRAPEGARIGAERTPVAIGDGAPTALPPLRLGPYLLGLGEVYDLPIDEFMAEGVYEYRCSSHDYRGLLVVVDDLEL